MATTNGEQRTRLDEAIDAAVRDMMRREPPAGFGGRLAGRLNPATSRRSWLMPALVSAAIVVVAVAALLLTNMRAPASPGQSATPAPVVAAPTRAPADPVTQRAVGERPIEQPTAAAAARRTLKPDHTAPSAESIFGPRRGAVAATSVAPDSRLRVANPTDEALSPDHPALAIPPLAPPDAIVIAPIEIKRIVIPARSGQQ